MALLEKRLEIYFNIGKDCKIDVECITNDIISQKCLFDPNCETFFVKKIRRYFWFGKTRKYIEYFMKINFFMLSKSISNKIGGRKTCRWWPAVLFQSGQEIGNERRLKTLFSSMEWQAGNGPTRHRLLGPNIQGSFFIFEKWWHFEKKLFVPVLF